ncbi:hypothetical protein GCM10009570_10200 [Dietzia natronolimnaea]
MPTSAAVAVGASPADNTNANVAPANPRNLKYFIASRPSARAWSFANTAMMTVCYDVSARID